MDIATAEIIGRKSKALKHCDKLLTQINKKGSARVKLNCTGVSFEVQKDDAIYLRIQATRYTLLDEIRSYEVTSRAKRDIEHSIRRTAPAPVGAAPASEVLSAEELEKKRKQSEYNHQYYLRKKAERQAKNPQ